MRHGWEASSPSVTARARSPRTPSAAAVCYAAAVGSVARHCGVCGALASLLACEFSPLGPGPDFRPGVYTVDVTVNDGCNQVAVMDTPLDCRAGLQLDDEGGLSVAWPEVDGATYVVNDGLMPRVAESPVIRWSTSGIEPSADCDGAAMRWIVTLANDDAGALSGSLRNSWTGVMACPVVPSRPQTECSTTFAYRYTLEEPCDAPCTLVEADATVDGPYDCGLAACECP